MRKAVRPFYGKLSVLETELLGAGDTKLDIVGCVDKTSNHRHTHVKGKLDFVRVTHELRHGIPNIHSLGLFHEFPGTYTIRTEKVFASHRLDDFISPFLGY